MPKKPFVGVIALCKDEIDALKVISVQLTEVLEQEDFKSHVVYVDGNSTDGSYEYLKESGFHVISQAIPGIPEALRAGIASAMELGCTYIVMFQPDGNCDPKLVPRLVLPLIDGSADLVIGSRYTRTSWSPDDSALTFVGNGLFRIMYRLRFPSSRLRDPIVGFRAFPTQLLQELDLLNSLEYRWLESILKATLGFDPLLTTRALSAGLNVIEVDAPEGLRIGGVPKRTAWRWGVAYTTQLWLDQAIRVCKKKKRFSKKTRATIDVGRNT
jgi:glycosyltransferase involved in cell wall biosynthesis